MYAAVLENINLAKLKIIKLKDEKDFEIYFSTGAV